MFFCCFPDTTPGPNAVVECLLQASPVHLYDALCSIRPKLGSHVLDSMLYYNVVTDSSVTALGLSQDWKNSSGHTRLAAGRYGFLNIPQLRFHVQVPAYHLNQI
ncbi:hypothetical protein E2C01_027813 [Portunus trituberculatus]|uniref:Uncharacterized protein n=1 Tax=Portunus trituberculatus TaxID=210409 RepID=A0A5B7EPV9_PORTR|nr:hypothetical protein [Portunus trituberculatus]